MVTIDKQGKDFEKAARLVGADESPDALDRVFGKLDVAKKPAHDDSGESQEGKADERHDPTEDAD